MELTQRTGTARFAGVRIPCARSGHCVVRAGNERFYLIGGVTGSRENYRPVMATEEYDPASATWRSRRPLPAARSSMGAALGANGKIYVIGGSDRIWYEYVDLANVEEYDPDSDSWSSRAAMPTPRQSLGVAAATDGKIYAVGGFSNRQMLPTVEAYDPDSDSWSSAPAMPTPRWAMGVVAAGNGLIYVIGGQDAKFNNIPVVEAYDPVAERWTRMADMPLPCSYNAVVATAQGTIYSIAGNGVVGTIQEYDLIHDRWAIATCLPVDLADIAACQAADGTIYLFGGVDSDGRTHDWVDCTQTNMVFVTRSEVIHITLE